MDRARALTGVGNRRGSSAALAALGLLLAGCGQTITGSAVPDWVAPPHRLDARLSDLLPPPSAFPAPYRAIVLEPHAVAQAAGDLAGIPPGAKVDPAGCKPAQVDSSPDGTAIVVGTDEDTRATITVELKRSDQQLAQRRAQLQQCPDVRSTHHGVTSQVHSELLPAPVVDADDALAVRQTVRSGTVVTLTQSMLTLVAQRDDVRISATYMSFDSRRPDTAALDEVFSAAVQRVAQA